MIHGICPGVKCPEGRERKCSLCPHLITGKLFIEGVQHQANLAFSRLFHLSNELKKEGDKGYENHAGDEGLEIMGWWDILQKIERDMNPEAHLSSDSLPTMKQREKGLLSFKSLPKELAYLENAYNARQLGVEQDRFGLKVLAIKALSFARRMGETEKVFEIMEDDEQVVDYLISYYVDFKQRGQLSEFVQQLSLPLKKTLSAAM